MLALPFEMPVSRTSKAAVLDGVVAKGQSGLVFRGAPVDEACAERVQAAVRQRVQGLRSRLWQRLQPGNARALLNWLFG